MTQLSSSSLVNPEMNSTGRCGARARLFAPALRVVRGAFQLDTRALRLLQIFLLPLGQSQLRRVLQRRDHCGLHAAGASEEVAVHKQHAALASTGHVHSRA